jgi:cell division transport system permease protein
MRALKRALLNISYNRLVFFLNGLILAAARMLLGFAALALFNVHFLTASWEEVNNVVLYLDNTLEEGEQKKLAALLKNWPEVAEVRLVNPETAIKEFTQLSAEAKELMSGLPATIFPPALDLTIHNMAQDDFKSFILKLGSTPGLIYLDYGPDIYEDVGKISGCLRVVALVAALIIMLLIMVIAAFTIKVALYQRRREIEVEWLVGATPAFIKMPFLWEGGIMGLCAGLVAAAVFAAFSLVAPIGEEILATFLPAIPIKLFDARLCPLLLLAGPFLALPGTFWGLRRVLK